MPVSSWIQAEIAQASRVSAVARPADLIFIRVAHQPVPGFGVSRGVCRLQVTAGSS
jgi:hypothetical protein